MLNWLRQRVGLLERRWIRNPEERAEHRELVRERLAQPDEASDATLPDAEPEPPVRTTRG